MIGVRAEIYIIEIKIDTNSVSTTAVDENHKFHLSFPINKILINIFIIGELSLVATIDQQSRFDN